jgi:hypothetical protein
MFNQKVVARLSCLALVLLLTSVAWGAAPGPFQAVQPYRSGGWTAVWNVLADVNGDGKLDLLVANAL